MLPICFLVCIIFTFSHHNTCFFKSNTCFFRFGFSKSDPLGGAYEQRFGSVFRGSVRFGFPRFGSVFPPEPPKRATLSTRSVGDEKKKQKVRNVEKLLFIWWKNRTEPRKTEPNRTTENRPEPLFISAT